MIIYSIGIWYKRDTDEEHQHNSRYLWQALHNSVLTFGLGQYDVVLVSQTHALSKLYFLIEIPTFRNFLDNKVYGANMGRTWVLSTPDGPYIGPTNLAIRAICWSLTLILTNCIHNLRSVHVGFRLPFLAPDGRQTCVAPELVSQTKFLTRVGRQWYIRYS